MTEQPKPGRPIIPEGYGTPKDGSGAEFLPWDEIEKWLAKSRNYWIISTRPDGRPHAIPVWGLWLDGALMFSTSRDSIKGRNLAERPDVVAHLESGDEVVILEGRAEDVSKADLSRYIDEYDEKYGLRPEPPGPGEVVYRLRPKIALTWLERDYPNTATRWVFR